MPRATIFRRIILPDDARDHSRRSATDDAQDHVACLSNPLPRWSPAFIARQRGQATLPRRLPPDHTAIWYLVIKSAHGSSRSSRSTSRRASSGAAWHGPGKAPPTTNSDEDKEMNGKLKFMDVTTMTGTDPGDGSRRRPR